jgi:hypothetical protein
MFLVHVLTPNSRVFVSILGFLAQLGMVLTWDHQIWNLLNILPVWQYARDIFHVLPHKHKSIPIHLFFRNMPGPYIPGCGQDVIYSC